MTTMKRTVSQFYSNYCDCFISQAESDEERLEWMMDISKQIAKLKTDSLTN